MGIQRWMGGLALAVCGTTLFACAGGDPFAEGDEEQVAERAEDSSPDQEVETIVPETTKVLSPEAQAALVSFDQESGTLRFNRDSAGALPSSPHQVADPVELGTDDVVMSVPTPAAPYGVLRRVTEVIEDGEEIVVNTSEASIGDAIEQAKVKVSLPMGGMQVTTVVPGATFSVEPKDPDERAVIGVGFQGTANLTLPQGFDFYTNGTCKLTEPQVFNSQVAAVLGLEITGGSVRQFGVFAQALANLNVKIECHQSKSNQNFTIARAVSPIYVYWITPDIPLVYQFGIAVIGGIESDTLDMTLTATRKEFYEAGLGWQSGTGWGPWSTHEVQDFQFDARGNGKTKVRTGPAAALSLFAGVVFDAFSWVEIGFGVGATGIVYALPFVEGNSTADLETGHGSATLHAGLEAGAAAGIFVELSVALWGWEILSETWRWIYQAVIPTIRYQLASISF